MRLRMGCVWWGYRGGRFARLGFSRFALVATWHEATDVMRIAMRGMDTRSHASGRDGETHVRRRRREEEEPRRRTRGWRTRAEGTGDARGVQAKENGEMRRTEARAHVRRKATRASHTRFLVRRNRGRTPTETCVRTSTHRMACPHVHERSWRCVRTFVHHNETHVRVHLPSFASTHTPHVR